MFPAGELLSFMDLLDLDEEIIDCRLATIMERSNFADSHLRNAIHLLKYKQLINSREDSECENDTEYNFVSKLLNNVEEDNVDNICKIVNIVLSLNPNSLISKSEHLVQQILCNMDLPTQPITSSTNDDEKFCRALLHLRICSSIFEAVINNNKILSLPFLEAPLENILYSNHDKLKGYFLTTIVPLLFKGLHGYSILDRIWKCIINPNSNLDIALKTLSCLSDYYLPNVDSKGVNLESDIVFKDKFWEFISEGLLSESLHRRMSVYLAKRALDYLTYLKKDAHVKSQNKIIFEWNNDNHVEQKLIWDNFFILLDSLEEKQSNIVLPSLRLLDTLQSMPECWLNSIYNLGLKHENTQVRLKCIEYRLRTKLYEASEAKVLLEALNDTYLFDKNTNYNALKSKLSTVLSNVNTVMSFLKIIPDIKWLPVPLFHISEVLATVRKDLLNCYDQSDISETILNILKIPCNNILLRKAVHLNVSHLVGNCCRGFHWKEYLNLYSYFQFDSYSEESRNSNPLLMYLKENTLIPSNDIKSLFILMTTVEKNIDFGIFYIETHPVNVADLLTIFKRMVSNIEEVTKSQFTDKSSCFKDLISLLNIFNKTFGKDYTALENIGSIMKLVHEIVLKYLISLLESDTKLSMEEIKKLFERLRQMLDVLFDFNATDVVFNVYDSCILILKDSDVAIEKNILAIHILCALLSCPLIIHNDRNIFDLDSFMGLSKSLGLEESSKETNGRLKNILYERYCEVLYIVIATRQQNVTKEFIDFIYNAAECGGFGCLVWILKIMAKVFPLLLKLELDQTVFLERMWKEIEELKSNNQYSVCMKEFVDIITDDILLSHPTYKKVLLSYWLKIIEYGTMKNTPLFFLISAINGKDISKCITIVYALCEIILFSPIPRKDQRITDNLSIEILDQSKYGIDNKSFDVHFNFHIQYLSYCVLSKIVDPEILSAINSFMINKINLMFFHKNRYHGNSQTHRTLLTAMQTFLMIMLKSREVNMESTAAWCMKILGLVPHQPSVRICLEWYIALYFIFKDIKITQETVELLKSNNIPLTSQFIILYWIIKFKIEHGPIKMEEYDFVMNILLNHTMGQIFSLRLHAQYLAAKLFEMNDGKPEKYEFTIQVIRRTFRDSETDKGFKKLQRDYFANDFDLILDFLPSFIYYFLPRYCEMYINEKVDKNFVKEILQNIDGNSFVKDSSRIFRIKWSKYENRHDQFYDLFITDIKESNDEEFKGTIQKKYVPWKNMNDVNMYEVNERGSNGDLIVVASLIDKLPNLGGLARTSEVFGVTTYVVDSLRHLQDKRFQGLSVSAERWINVEEVRPSGLKQYLMEKKDEGYSVVAAEQTSSSCQLQTFKFPRKTLLLLGHEKEGVPCDLLPLMDHCVEIPQRGVVRSLNVHVTAAIFVWEFRRQMM